MTIKSILGKMFVNDKQIVVLDDTAENGGIESGSNANGSYVKYPDGTLICYGRATTTITTTSLVTFPMAFISIPSLSGIADNSSSDWGQNPKSSDVTVSTFNATLISINPAGGTSYNASGYSYTAIGRWK